MRMDQIKTMPITLTASEGATGASVAQRARAETQALIAGLKPGDSVTYHRGFLIDDRERDAALAAVAKEFLNAAESWRGYLLQRRVGDGSYEYIFTRAARLAF